MKVNADSDWNEAAAAIEASLMSEEDHFTTVDSDEEWLANEQPQALLDVLRTLSDGELYDGIVETDDGYYVVRLDHVNDEEATQEIIDEETEARKNDYYEEVTDAMLTSADIKVNDKVLSDLKITDKHTFTLVSSEGSTDEAGEVVEAETEAVSETAAEAASEAETEAAGETETEAATENKDEAKKDAAEETVTTEAVTEKEK